MAAPSSDENGGTRRVRGGYHGHPPVRYDSPPVLRTVTRTVTAHDRRMFHERFVSDAHSREHRYAALRGSRGPAERGPVPVRTDAGGHRPGTTESREPR